MRSDGTMTWYDYQKMQHRCTACGTRDAYTMTGRVLCADCNERNNERIRQLYRKDRRSKLDAQKERYERLRSAGICIQCGARSVIDTGYSRCEICRALNARRRQKTSKKNSRDTANQCGLCYKCFKPLGENDDKMCGECRQKMLEFSRLGRESQGESIGAEWEKSW